MYSSASLDYRNFTEIDLYLSAIVNTGVRYVYGNGLIENLTKLSGVQDNFVLVKLNTIGNAIYEIRKK